MVTSNGSLGDRRRRTTTVFVFVVMSIGLVDVTHASTTAKRNCGSPPVPRNARLASPNIIANVTSGTTVQYQCDLGYELFGSDKLSCSDDGHWQGELPFCAVNVAYRKPANQSTTVRGGDASHANDGNDNTLHEGKHCSETRKEGSPWWRVDLQRSYDVRVIRVFSPAGGVHKLQDIEIRVGNSTVISRNRLCAWNPGILEEGVRKDFPCAQSSTGRFVFLQMVGVEGALSICEIQIFTTQELSSERCSTANTSDLVQSFNHVCFDFQLKRGSDLQGARKHCQDLGGDLVHDIDNVTNNFLIGELEMFRSVMTAQLVWIGAVKEPKVTSRVWHWVEGSAVVRPMWGPEQPNNYNGEQNCVVLDGSRGWMWNDVGCNLNYLPWICQYEPPSCGSPDLNVNTSIRILSGQNNGIGGMIQYECPLGSAVVGNATRRCQSDGSWTNSAPTCKHVDCGPLPVISNGTLEFADNRTTFDATVRYVCKDGYTLSAPNDSRNCGPDGKWTGDDTMTCLYKFCGEPGKPADGTVTLSDGLSAGSVANYSCPRGHLMVGDSQRKCRMGGEWTGKTPECQLIDCKEPRRVANGIYVLPYNSTLYEGEVLYLCDLEYALHGPNRRTCTKNGTWSEEDPTCELITCREPDVRPNSFVVADGFHVSSTAEYFCDPSHVLEGSSNRTCGLDGKWAGRAPRCRFVECGHVQPVLHGQVDYINLTTHLNSIVSYTCAPGYRLGGNGTRICESPGRWSGNTPVCEEIRCNEPDRPPNSVLSVSGNDRSGDGDTFKVGSTVQFRCEKGYTGHGQAKQTCEPMGQWTGEPAVCLYVDCLYPEPLAYGEVVLLSNTTYYGSTVEYVCQEHYELHGISRRQCLDNGTWEGSTPHCQEINCGKPDKPPSVLAIDVSNLTMEAVATYRCNVGQRVVGNETRICMRNGRWSSTAPTCELIDCGRPVSPQSGEIYLLNQSTTYLSVVEYHCFFGYKLVGPATRICHEDGRWNSDDGRCELDKSNNDVIGDNSLTKPIASAGDESGSDLVMSKTIGLVIGIGAGGLLLLAIIIALVYMKLRRPKPGLHAPEENLQARRPMMMAAPENGLRASSTFTGTTNNGYTVETDLSTVDGDLMPDIEEDATAAAASRAGHPTNSHSIRS